MVKIEEIEGYFVDNKHSFEVSIAPINTYLINEEIHLKSISSKSFFHIIHPELNDSCEDLIQTSVPSRHEKARETLKYLIENKVYNKEP